MYCRVTLKGENLDEYNANLIHHCSLTILILNPDNTLIHSPSSLSFFFRIAAHVVEVPSMHDARKQLVNEGKLPHARRRSIDVGRKSVDAAAAGSTNA